MEITAAMVKELRNMTGSGVMDCKRALVESEGDYDKAVEVLREKGLASAEKKASRIAAEGIVWVSVKDDVTAIIVEVNSETDFVAQNDTFRTFVADVAEQILTSDVGTVEELAEQKWIKDASKTVQEELVSQIAVIGEKLSIRRFVKINAENGVVVPYLHGGGRIGVLVDAESAVVNAEVKEALKNVAMQVAALSPKYVSRDEISDEYIEHEKEILKAQASNENPDKPESIIEKMIIGRLNKELKEVCLLDQIYVKDGDLTVAKYLEQVSKAVGTDIKIKSFVRFETGEGIEKKEENFAEEVAKQMSK
ncbi:translation elongation factor Ts [Parasporobacterium paucivorans]|uniref:Elongation factor Ts n=1 Tax=Parasporobacterium paucivorans DSM 15970 TaxID=1122934 RepID=A0A1M6AHV1_9FIRM|nr:translation elongation factor Ts [Parasporobacterium paucivorans]SHI36007.1 elongation factor Ts [Parasporobacterium paucivorans DSM 15970]